MRRKLVVAAACLLGAPLLAELAFRALEARLGVERWNIDGERTLLTEGRMLHFVPNPHTVFQRPARPPYNSYGFNDVEWSLEKTPGVPRILCLGGSTTEGGNDSGPTGRFPQQLEVLLEQRAGRPFEVMNAGISGWTTAEILVAWFLTLQDFQPDLVVIHEGVNDTPSRFLTGFRSDYSHWRVPMHPPETNSFTRALARWSDLYLYLRLKREGVPDIGTLTTVEKGKRVPGMRTGVLAPETARPFRRNVASIARSARALGAEVALMTMPWKRSKSLAVWNTGMGEHNRILAELAAEEGYYLVDAAGLFERESERLEKEFLDLVHVTAEGNQAKAELLAGILMERWVPGLPPQQPAPAMAQPVGKGAKRGEHGIR